VTSWALPRLRPQVLPRQAAALWMLAAHYLAHHMLALEQVMVSMGMMQWRRREGDYGVTHDLRPFSQSQWAHLYLQQQPRHDHHN
jgi:hypothetical protein